MENRSKMNPNILANKPILKVNGIDSSIRIFSIMLFNQYVIKRTIQKIKINQLIPLSILLKRFF